jgi:hypothetical protein
VEVCHPHHGIYPKGGIEVRVGVANLPLWVNSMVWMTNLHRLASPCTRLVMYVYLYPRVDLCKQERGWDVQVSHSRPNKSSLPTRAGWPKSPIDSGHDLSGSACPSQSQKKFPVSRVNGGLRPSRTCRLWTRGIFFGFETDMPTLTSRTPLHPLEPRRRDRRLIRHA